MTEKRTAKKVMNEFIRDMNSSDSVRPGKGDSNYSIYGPVLNRLGDHIAALPVGGRSVAVANNLPEGSDQLNEFGTVWWYDGAVIDYHDHQWGYETFMVTSGKVDAVLNHKRVMLTKGDIFFIKPQVAHAFVSYETEKSKGATWFELYENMNMYEGIESQVVFAENYPDLEENSDYLRSVEWSLGDFYRKEVPKIDFVHKKEVPWVRTPEFSSRTFENKIGKFMQKISRWDFDGLKEIWEFQPAKGLTMEFGIPCGNSPLYYVLQGEMITECEGRTYVAKQDDCIHIPPWRKHNVFFTEEGTRVLICNEQSYLLQILETLNSMSKISPSKLKDWDKNIVPILRDNNSWLTNISGI